MDQLIAHLKAQGFVFQGSEIYGGLANSWDYGPLGVELKNKIKKAWWDHFVKTEPMNVGLDSSIILNPKVWEASGHIGGFNDPLIDCKKCRSRWRADKLVEEYDSTINAGSMNEKELESFIVNHKIKCPNCEACDYTKIRNFALMFKTNQGVLEDSSSTVFLRPETAQGIFINFKNVQRSLRKKLPFGIGQIGKSFRNEITPGNFIFRTREFEQMELEFFFDPNDTTDWYKYWVASVESFLQNTIGIKKENYRVREHEKEELAHYSDATKDIEFKFPFGWGELWGIAHRGNFDLNAHQKVSKEDLTYLDPLTHTRFLPNVIEPSVGVERLILALFCQAYTEEKIGEENSRIVMKFPNKLAPYQVAVMPLQKQQSEEAKKLFKDLIKSFDATYDDTGNVGKRYRRQDAIGTPFVITVDFDSAEKNDVTVRFRDSMRQERIAYSELKNFLSDNLK